MTLSKPPLLVFSDLDGTLLDHEDYDWSPARPALERLEALGAGVVLASSKTASEIAVLRSTLGLDSWPAIVENGAGLLPSGQSAAVDDEAYRQLRTVLDTLPEPWRRKFVGFGDMSEAEVAEITGLPLAQARLARQRAFSEPGQWAGSEADKADFLSALAQQGVRAQQGGRFLTLSFGANKADQVRRLTQQQQPDLTIALGDAPNDVAMLEAADIAVVIHNPHASVLPPLAGEGQGRHVIRTTEPGPVGWNATILSLLDSRFPIEN